jgi:hypothetical protein
MPRAWTKPYHGVTHCGELTDWRRVTVTEITPAFATLTRWTRGAALTSIPTDHYDSAAEAKTAGERWLDEASR